MSENKNIVLTIVGMLNLEEFPTLKPFSHRIEHRALVPHENLVGEIARFDINLAPLEVDNPFCEAKSELKFYEAALVRVPTVASATSTFCSAIRDRITGYLARSNEEWGEALNDLISDKSVRSRIATAAYEIAQAEYGPDAKKRMVGHLFRGIIEDRQKRLQAAPEAYSQTITFVIPGMIKGSGGHNKILSIAKWMAHFGHTILLTFTGATNDYPDPQGIVDDYDLDDRSVRVIYSEEVIATSNVTFATYWSTVYNVDKSEYYAGRKFHFLQDYEPYFFPMGTQYLLAVNALTKDFRKISYGQWIKRLILKRHGILSESIPFYFDKDIYFPDTTVTRKQNAVVFFARPSMPRRCFDLGIEALTKYQRKYGLGTEILLFGSNFSSDVNLPFEARMLGVLTPQALRRLYSEATIGLVFSPTNPSMVPFEMMACGLPVIDVDVDGNEENYGGRRNVFLVSPDPDQIADIINVALNEHDRRIDVARNALAFASSMNDEKSAVESLTILVKSNLRKNLSASL
jgi:glycosyltransferase involved in cell wall biosynthesis